MSHYEDQSPGVALSQDVADVYRSRWGHSPVLDEFRNENGFWCLFDSTPAGRTDMTVPANRILATWGYTKPDRVIGDRRRLRHFPLPKRPGRPLDRGHLIAMASGGSEHVNIVPQASKLNRGYTADGRRWRALERFCARNSGVFVFIAVHYEDVTDVPSAFTYRVQNGNGKEQIERFRNYDDDC